MNESKCFSSLNAEANRDNGGRSSRLANRPFNKRLLQVGRTLGPTLIALSLATAAHAQGTMDFSGAQTLMGTFNSRFAYVSVSRASHDAQVFTNDASNLAERLSTDVTKASALDFGTREAQAPYIIKSQIQSQNQTIGIGLELAR